MFVFYLFPIIFMLAFGIIIFVIIKVILEWNKNNNSPVIIVESKIVSKRANISSYHNGIDNNMHMNYSTTYYVTFELESKDRMEFRVNGREYGILSEGDIGKLTFQGTRYKCFERSKEK